LTSPGNDIYVYIWANVLSAPPDLSERKEVIPIAKTTIKEVYKRMSLIIDPDLHRAFKAATAARGEEMTEVLLQFIRGYIEKYAPKELKPKGGR
jgi:hypothetical protein